MLAWLLFSLLFRNLGSLLLFDLSFGRFIWLISLIVLFLLQDLDHNLPSFRSTFINIQLIWIYVYILQKNDFLPQLENDVSAHPWSAYCLQKLIKDKSHQKPTFSQQPNIKKKDTSVIGQCWISWYAFTR